MGKTDDVELWLKGFLCEPGNSLASTSLRLKEPVVVLRGREIRLVPVLPGEHFVTPDQYTGRLV